MVVVRSTGPYWLAGGRAWCARCRRTALTRIGTSTRFECTLCDRAALDIPDDPAVMIRDGEVTCSRCTVNTMMPTGPAGALECPSCDLPPWERHKLDTGVHVQETLDGGISAMVAEARAERPNRPAKPQDVTRGCFYCFQTTRHTFEWEFSRWRAKCTACGNRIQLSRVKSTRAKKRRGQQ